MIFQYCTAKYISVDDEAIYAVMVSIISKLYIRQRIRRTCWSTSHRLGPPRGKIEEDWLPRSASGRGCLEQIVKQIIFFNWKYLTERAVTEVRGASHCEETSLLVVIGAGESLTLRHCGGLLSLLGETAWPIDTTVSHINIKLKEISEVWLLASDWFTDNLEILRLSVRYRTSSHYIGGWN